MREVAWVIFDEIHYMRDSGNVYLHINCLQKSTLDLSREEMMFGK